MNDFSAPKVWKTEFQSTVQWNIPRYAGRPPQDFRDAAGIAYEGPRGDGKAKGRGSDADAGEVVGFMPIRFSQRHGFYMDERGNLGDVDVKVLRRRGKQGAGSA